ncbi:uncharacterized protein LOC110875823 [Helianthus annuus]|uniref:uncharacterized protein LOC110875823 n=1 Tax=Helianthus annuus TaxID=4232 RepID=UPI001652BC44|nr:uncharacterized protein LOC110875823 [Helianthus annuus]
MSWLIIMTFHIALRCYREKGFYYVSKCTSALRQLVYGTASDSWDEYLRMSERMSQECLYEFSKGIVNMYSKLYLRKLTKKDIEKFYAFHEETHRFPRMLGSIDCMHWRWRTCPTAWRGQHMRGDIGSNNNLNVVARSHSFDDIIRGMGPDCPFLLNGVSYKHRYYLADGIYPSYMAIVKTIPEPHDEKRKKFANYQEAARKDVER